MWHSQGMSSNTKLSLYMITGFEIAPKRKLVTVKISDMVFGLDVGIIDRHGNINQKPNLYLIEWHCLRI